MFLAVFGFPLPEEYQIEGRLGVDEAVFAVFQVLQRFTRQKALVVTIFGSGMSCREWLTAF